MYSWIVKRLLAFIYEQKLVKGQLRLPLLALAADVRLVFAGESSFGGEHRGKPAVAAWMRRFASLRPEFHVHDAAVAGPPWNTRIFMRFTDRMVAPDGHVYENAGAEWILVRWGLIHELRVYLDTEKVTALDAHLGSPSSSSAHPVVQQAQRPAAVG